jgi:hypothetical protein
VVIDVDALANEIRRVDGNNDKGAGALAEALMPFLTLSLAPQVPTMTMQPLGAEFQAAINVNREELYEPSAALMPQVKETPWQSMETAPKDGKHSIFAIKFGPFVYSIQGTWDAHKKKWINAADREGEYLAWMPNIKLPDEFCPWTDEYKSRVALEGNGHE